MAVIILDLPAGHVQIVQALKNDPSALDGMQNAAAVHIQPADRLNLLWEEREEWGESEWRGAAASASRCSHCRSLPP